MRRCLSVVALLSLGGCYEFAKDYDRKKAIERRDQRDEYYANAAADRAAGEVVERQRIRERENERYAERSASLAAVSPAEPRGFYCTTSDASPNDGRCTRDKGDCEQGRDLALASTPDLGECTLVEDATCFSTQCYPTGDACDAARGPDGVGQCVVKH
ncbi:MAG TPA: hypothetical protein VGM90_29870 [Kofleriaceae bacterium]|jgi:hypothetical protein